jgi:hypothetical protein
METLLERTSILELNLIDAAQRRQIIRIFQGSSSI